MHVDILSQKKKKKKRKKKKKLKWQVREKKILEKRTWEKKPETKSILITILLTVTKKY